MEGVTKIAMYLIPILVLVLLGTYYPEMFEKFKDVGGKVQEYLPNVSIGAEKLQASKPFVSEDNKNQILSLKDSLNKMIGKGPCFMQYQKFSLLEGASLRASYDGVNDQTNFGVYGGAGASQYVNDLSFSVKGMKLCVIAGKDNSAVKAFSKIYFSPISVDKYSAPDVWSVRMDLLKDNPQHYTTVSKIDLGYYEGKTFLCKNSNHIVVPELGIGENTNVCDNFNDDGILYTPDGKNICFFPTVYGDTFSYDKDGLNDKYLGNNKKDEQALLFQLLDGKLKRCVSS